MAVIKEKNAKKFSKSTTDMDVPVIARAAQVAQGLSLTSSGEIDTNNTETLYFHIFGDLPSQILLYIYGEKFNQNYYTEVGEHSHGAGTYQTGNVNTGTTNHQHSGSTVSLGDHNHTASAAGTNLIHTHSLYVGNTDAGYKIDIDGGSSGNNFRLTFPTSGTQIIGSSLGSHQHTISVSNRNLGSPGLTIVANNLNTHGHLVTSGSSANRGLSPFSGSMHLSGSAKSYFDDLKIEINGVDKTADLLAQAGLAKFGDGTSGHLIVTNGVLLDLVPFIPTPGQQKIVFSLTGSANNGGKLRYNLYTIA